MAKRTAHDSERVAVVRQLIAVAVAAVLLGVGLAGPPLDPLRAFLAGVLVVGTAVLLTRRASPMLTFFVGFFGVLLTHFLQDEDPYLFGTGIVALGLGTLAASSYGRRLAPTFLIGVGAVIGASLFFGSVPSGY